MSLLSRERLAIGLAPERLSALRVTGNLRPRIEQRYDVALQTPNGAQWETPLTALEVLLDQAEWSGHDLSVILSNHYVHYARIPESQGLATAERNDLARLIFRKLFGELSHDWELRVSPAGDLPTLASGVPQSFLKALHNACDGRGRLRSIQPALMTVFNNVRSVLGQNKGTLALVEAGRISLAAIENGQWQAIVSRAGSSNTLAPLLQDEDELHGRNPGGMLWLCDLTGEARFPADSSWRLERLQPAHGAANSVASLAEWSIQ